MGQVSKLYDPFANQDDDEFEKDMQVLEKYTSFGAISTFKGKKEMRELKNSLQIKKYMESILTRMGEQEAIVGYTFEELEGAKVLK